MNGSSNKLWQEQQALPYGHVRRLESIDTASQSDDPSNNGTFSYMLHKKKESFGMLEVKSAYLSFLNQFGRLLGLAEETALKMLHK